MGSEEESHLLSPTPYSPLPRHRIPPRRRPYAVRRRATPPIRAAAHDLAGAEVEAGRAPAVYRPPPCVPLVYGLLVDGLLVDALACGLLTCRFPACGLRARGVRLRSNAMRRSTTPAVRAAPHDLPGTEVEPGAAHLGQICPGRGLRWLLPHDVWSLLRRGATHQPQRGHDKRKQDCQSFHRFPLLQSVAPPPPPEPHPTTILPNSKRNRRQPAEPQRHGSRTCPACEILRRPGNKSARSTRYEAFLIVSRQSICVLRSTHRIKKGVMPASDPPGLTPPTATAPPAPS